MTYSIRQENGFEFIEEGQGHPIVMLHGLFGALSNWSGVLEHFHNGYRVIIPLMPIYKGKPVAKTVEDLQHFVQGFLKDRRYGPVSLVGNSLGGHVGQLVALDTPEQVATLTLTGASGLFESGMGMGFIKRSDYDFIEDRVAFTFYSPETATKELVDEVYGLVNDRMSAMRVVTVARNAQKHNLREELARLHTPTCLIWGLNDNITPPTVAHEFYHLLPNAELHFLDHCGHAPMMEQSDHFNHVLEGFLARNGYASQAVSIVT